MARDRRANGFRQAPSRDLTSRFLTLNALGFEWEPVSRSRWHRLEEGDRVENADAQLTRASGGLTDYGATEFEARA